VEHGLLADAGVERRAPHRQPGRVAADDAYAFAEPHESRQVLRALRAAGVQLHGDDAAASAAREEACRTREARADVEDARLRADAGSRRERIDGADPAVVVLIEVEQVVGGERGAAAALGDGGEHVLGGNRMIVVEVVDAQGRSLKRCLAYGKSYAFSTPSVREPP
jgi:hypothetical protein